MAELTLNSALRDIHGRIDNWVYRRYGGRTIIARRPAGGGEPSAGQLAHRERFRAAAAYARSVLADPVRLPPYQAAAKIRDLPVFAFIVGDYLNPPEVQAIDASGYHGAAGEPVKVTATDDFSVVAVDVVLRHAAGDVLEQGPAVLTGGVWIYPTTGTVASGETVTIEATARDLPGHPGSRSLAWLIA